MHECCSDTSIAHLVNWSRVVGGGGGGIPNNHTSLAVRYRSCLHAGCAASWCSCGHCAAHMLVWQRLICITHKDRVAVLWFVPCVLRDCTRIHDCVTGQPTRVLYRGHSCSARVSVIESKTASLVPYFKCCRVGGTKLLRCLVNLQSTSP